MNFFNCDISNGIRFYDRFNVLSKSLSTKVCWCNCIWMFACILDGSRMIPVNFPTSQHPPDVAHSLPTEIPSQHPDVVPRTPRTPRGKDPEVYPRFYPVVKESGAPKDPQVI